MKIERLTENSIRCTLNRADLDSRDLKLGELAYGTEKAKNLFKDMIAQASYECGFEAEDIPLMIEAIPVSADCIVLVITKVEDPEELDTRFSKFAPSDDIDIDEYGDTIDEEPDPMSMLDKAGELFNKLSGNEDDFIPFSSMMDKLKEKKTEVSTDVSPSKEAAPEDNTPTIIEKLYSFPDFGTINNACAAISASFMGASTIYKDEKLGKYILFINSADMNADTFTGICNVLTEYGKREKFTYATLSYLEEHCEVLIKNNAVAIMASL